VSNNEVLKSGVWAVLGTAIGALDINIRMILLNGGKVTIY
jgi:hypothetical protein